MKTLTLAVVFALGLTASAAAQGTHGVKGYVKSNGTYVAPTRATNPNRTNVDNYSTKPNVNPYSGKVGTKAADYGYKPYTPPKPRKY